MQNRNYIGIIYLQTLLQISQSGVLVFRVEASKCGVTIVVEVWSISWSMLCFWRDIATRSVPRNELQLVQRCGARYRPVTAVR